MPEFKVVIKKKSPLADYDRINRNRIHYSNQLEASDQLEVSENNGHLPDIQYSARKTSLSQSKSPDLISDVTAGSSNVSQNNAPIYCPVCTDLLDDRVKRVYAKRIEGKVFLPFLEKAAYTRGFGRAKIKLCIPCYKHLVAQWKNYNLTEVPHEEREYKDRNGKSTSICLSFLLFYNLVCFSFLYVYLIARFFACSCYLFSLSFYFFFFIATQVYLINKLPIHICLVLPSFVSLVETCCCCYCCCCCFIVVFISSIFFKFNVSQPGKLIKVFCIKSNLNFTRFD